MNNRLLGTILVFIFMGVVSWLGFITAPKTPKHKIGFKYHAAISERRSNQSTLEDDLAKDFSIAGVIFGITSLAIFIQRKRG